MPQIQRFSPSDEQLHIFAPQFDCSASYAPNLGIFHQILQADFLATSNFLLLAYQKSLKTLAQNFPGPIFKSVFRWPGQGGGDRRRGAVLFVKRFFEKLKNIPLKNSSTPKTFKTPSPKNHKTVFVYLLGMELSSNLNFPKQSFQKFAGM